MKVTAYISQNVCEHGLYYDYHRANRNELHISLKSTRLLMQFSYIDRQTHYTRLEQVHGMHQNTNATCKLASNTKPCSIA